MNADAPNPLAWYDSVARQWVILLDGSRPAISHNLWRKRKGYGRPHYFVTAQEAYDAYEKERRESR